MNNKVKVYRITEGVTSRTYDLDLDVLANAHLAHAGTAHVLESGLHRLTLRIEHLRFWGNNDFGLHQWLCP